MAPNDEQHSRASATGVHPSNPLTPEPFCFRPLLLATKALTIPRFLGNFRESVYANGINAEEYRPCTVYFCTRRMVRSQVFCMHPSVISPFFCFYHVTPQND